MDPPTHAITGSSLESRARVYRARGLSRSLVDSQGIHRCWARYEKKAARITETDIQVCICICIYSHYSANKITHKRFATCSTRAAPPPPRAVESERASERARERERERERERARARAREREREHRRPPQLESAHRGQGNRGWVRVGPAETPVGLAAAGCRPVVPAQRVAGRGERDGVRE